MHENDLRKELGELNKKLGTLEKILDERDEKWSNIPEEVLEEAIVAPAIAKLLELFAEYIGVPKEVVELYRHPKSRGEKG